MPESQTAIPEYESEKRYDFFLDADEKYVDELSTKYADSSEFGEDDFYIVASNKKVYYKGKIEHEGSPKAKRENESGFFDLKDIVDIRVRRIRHTAIRTLSIIVLIVAVCYDMFERNFGFFGIDERLIFVGIEVLGLIILWMYFGSINNIMIFKLKDKDLEISTKGVSFKKFSAFMSKLFQLISKSKEC
ncbi:MAG TPA: hypothetical protein VHO94_01925 [Oscillospiraceae bacterium]|nr:hypothetical protein [Oscillospiraceae bacterium]